MSTSTPPTAAQAGWHPDPSGAAQHQYWDGQAWSEQVRPGAAPTVAPIYAPGPAAAPPGHRDW